MFGLLCKILGREEDRRGREGGKEGEEGKREERMKRWERSGEGEVDDGKLLWV